MLKGKIGPDHKLLSELVNKCVLPRTKHRHKMSHHDLGLVGTIDDQQKVNLPLFMLCHITRMINLERGSHGFAYGFLLTKVFEAHHIPLSAWKTGSQMDMFDKKTLEEYELLQPVPSAKGNGPMSQMFLDLQTANAQVVKLERENAKLKIELSAAHTEISSLKDKMLHQQTVHNNRIDKLLYLMENN